MSASSLERFLQQYQQHWQQQCGHLPLSDQADDGPAKVATTEQGWSHWQAQPNAEGVSFDNVAAALELTLDDSLSQFYGGFYAGSLFFTAEFGEGELLQLWNDEDLERLQQNLIGHLLMKQKLKQPPTLFIGLLGQGDQMIVLDNSDGSVWLEVPGQLPQQQLAPTLHQFIEQLTPRVQLPEAVTETLEPQTQGLGQRLLTMLSNLLPKRR